MEKISIQNVYVIARDVQACSRFYQSALGLQLKFQDGANWCQFDAQGRNFALSSKAEAPAEAQGTVVVFEATQLDAVADKVVAAGGRLVSTRDMGAHGQVKTFSDCEGNLFQVFAKTPRAAFASERPA